MKYYGGTESVAEAAFLVQLERASAGMPCPVVIQYKAGPYRADFAWPEVKVVTEIDGKAYHTSSSRFTGDRQKARFYAREGWRLIPFSGSEIMGDPEYCVKELFDSAHWEYPSELLPAADADVTKPLAPPLHNKAREEIVEIVRKSSSSVRLRGWNSSQ